MDIAETIRRATPDDLSTLLALLRDYYIEWNIWLRDPPEKTADDLSHPQLGFFLAEIGDTPAGCVLLRPLPSIPSSTECKRLFIASQFRGRGLAGRLMDAAEAHARRAGLHWVYLDSRAEMTTAINMYRRRGYEEIPRFNNNAEAAIFLRKRLIE